MPFDSPFVPVIRKSESKCLNFDRFNQKDIDQSIEDLKNLKDIVKRANLNIDKYEKNKLEKTASAIARKISLGYSDFEAISLVAKDSDINMNKAFLAYSVRENYRYSYEMFAKKMIVQKMVDANFSNYRIREVANFYDFSTLNRLKRKEEVYNFHNIREPKYFQLDFY
jgi:hypothetical protein